MPMNHNVFILVITSVVRYSKVRLDKNTVIRNESIDLPCFSDLRALFLFFSFAFVIFFPYY